METITITFGDRAENHVGMQMIGAPLKNNKFLQSLQGFHDYYRELGYECELEDLSRFGHHAKLLIVRNYTGEDFSGTALEDLSSLKWDTKAKMYGRVCDKKARYNLCFADWPQKPDYEAGKGRLYDFENVPCLRALREQLQEELLEVTKKKIELVAEGNYYYAKTCYIGFHGDTERKLVIGVRFGSDMKLLYQWYKGKNAAEEEREFLLGAGDLYIMSSKAIGSDWKVAARCDRYALRHSAKF